MTETIDLKENSINETVDSLVSALIVRAHRNGKCAEDVAKAILMEVLDHEWVDDQLTENIIVGLAKDIGIKVTGTEYED